MKEELKRLSEIRIEVKRLYGEKNRLETSVIDKVVESGSEKIMALNKNEVLELVWVFDKRIDYERLKLLYPEIYALGLETTFSANKALKSMDKKLFNLILNDCTTINPHYKVKYNKRRKKWMI